MAGTTVEQQVTTAASQCWECLRRKITCDGASLACRTCITTGIVCPGYENKQPLRWLPTGKVSSRTRKKPAVPPKSRQSAAKVLGKDEHDMPGPSGQLVIRTSTDAMVEAVIYCKRPLYLYWCIVYQVRLANVLAATHQTTTTFTPSTPR